MHACTHLLRFFFNCLQGDAKKVTEAQYARQKWCSACFLTWLSLLKAWNIWSEYSVDFIYALLACHFIFGLYVVASSWFQLSHCVISMLLANSQSEFLNHTWLKVRWHVGLLKDNPWVKKREKPLKKINHSWLCAVCLYITSSIHSPKI